MYRLTDQNLWHWQHQMFLSAILQLHRHLSFNFTNPSLRSFDKSSYLQLWRGHNHQIQAVGTAPPREEFIEQSSSGAGGVVVMWLVKSLVMVIYMTLINLYISTYTLRTWNLDNSNITSRGIHWVVP